MLCITSDLAKMLLVFFDIVVLKGGIEMKENKEDLLVNDYNPTSELDDYKKYNQKPEAANNEEYTDSKKQMAEESMALEVAYKAYQKRVSEICNLKIDADLREKHLREAAEAYDAEVERIQNPYAQYEQSNGKTR